MTSIEPSCAGLFTGSLCIALSACGGLVPNASDAAPGGTIDAKVGGQCDALAPFGPWESLGDALQPPGLLDVSGHPTADELTMYISGRTGSGRISFDLYVSTRKTRTELFGTPTLLNKLNSMGFEASPSISADGLSLFFETEREVATQVYVAKRTGLSAEFDSVVPAEGVNGGGIDAQPFLAADNSELWFISTRPGIGQSDIWSAKSAPGSAVEVKIVPAVNTTSNDWVPRVSTDKLTMYISSNRLGDPSDYDIWRSHRNSVTEDFPEPILVSELSFTGSLEIATWISPDNCRLYGTSNGIASVATRQP
jgi:hypothetical protein